MPGLAGDYFADSLTYICEHNEEGAMGIMVNRPNDMSLVELLAQLGLRANRDWVETQVFEGGPSIHRARAGAAPGREKIHLFSRAG